MSFMWLLAKMRQIAAWNDKIGQRAEKFTDNCEGEWTIENRK